MISAAGGCAVGHAANKGRRRYLNFFWSNGAGVEHRISIFSENEGGSKGHLEFFRKFIRFSTATLP